MSLLHLASLSLPSKMLPLQFHTTKVSSSFSSSIQCKSSSNSFNVNATLSSPIIRRSADFKPTIWHYDFIQSLGSKYMEESYAEKCQMLYKKEEEEEEEEEPLHQLEFIDVLQRLGVSYHFETEINNILGNHYKNIIKMDKLKGNEKDLYATSLEFRLLRQHGYHLSTEVFDRFLDEMSNFKQILSDDIKGVLSLYEASFLSMEDESILEKAREFSIEILEEYVREKKENDEMLMLINHALELPLHWRMQRWEALWFINAYESTTPNMIPSLLQFAKLDFNIGQAIHLEELKQTSRQLEGWDSWPKDLKLLHTQGRDRTP